ncbi:GLUG motif-containing protein, partial [Hydrogenophaga sp.]|uniref:two-partner secretion domain-containing protein n=1 Tax=Hydrogenophaga sp. TaxID=1904254 RepID=UPI00273660FA
MNHIYRLVWSQLTSTWIAVAESVRGQGKKSARKPLAAVIVASALSFSVSYAEPIGGQVTAGEGVISQTVNTTNINQTSQNLSLSWDKFNIAPHEVVNFVQPNSAAIAVNRIFDTNGSQILGQINANGKIYLINPNGILFGLGAQINVGGLVASTLNMSDASLNSSIRSFSGAGTGSITNQGTINTPEGGYVAFLGSTVSNQGSINAPLGTVALGAGSAATLTFDNNSLVQLQIDQSTLNNLAENKQLIKADGGMVIMSAGAKDSLLASVVNNTGVIEAQTLHNKSGVITLMGGMEAGTTYVAGTLDASAPVSGNGGFIETSAAHVKIADGIAITTSAANGKSGTWLIDPADFTISAAGTGTVTGGTPSGDISNTTLQNALATTDVNILSSQGSTAAGSGDINVNADVAWSANKLTLTAAHSINVNAVMTASGTSTLDLNTSTTNGGDTAVAGGTVNMGFKPDGSFAGSIEFGTRSGTELLKINNIPYTIINNFGIIGSTTVGDFQAMSTTGNYALGTSLIATGIATNGINAFTGMFNGLGHTITGVNITSAAAAGLFGTVGLGSYIQNVGLIGGSVAGAVNSGGLVGWNYGNISNSYNTGNVFSTGGGQGGLVGSNAAGTIDNSYATGSVEGAVNVGGLVGENGSGLITNSYATGAVTSTAAGVGGLVGYSTTGHISNSYATGIVKGATGVGGLLGGGTSGNVTNSHAIGAVTGTTNTGGLVGSITSGVVSASYSTGNVSGTTSTGGLVGLTTGLVTQSYATGNVTGSTNTGGLVANTTGGVSDSYATGTVIGSAGSSGGLVGITTGPVATSYAAGSSVSGITNGLIGTTSVPAQVTHSYYDKTLNNGVGTGTALTTAQMHTMSSFAGFDIANVVGSSAVWRIYEGATNPLLRSFLTPITLSSAYSGTAKALTNIGDYTANIANPISANINTSQAGLTLSSTTTAGTMTTMLSNVSSVQQGYDISYAPTTITGTGSAANDLNISHTIDWSSGTLSLVSQDNINFNETLNGSGTAKLALEYGQGAVAAGNLGDYNVSFDHPVNLPGGQNFNTTLGLDGVTKIYTVITTLGAVGDTTSPPVLTTLQGMAATTNLSGNFVLGNDINASDTSLTTYNGDAGFVPVGTLAFPFLGYFDGLGHTITDLNLDMGATANSGLFGYTMGPTRIQNVGLIGGSMNGGAATGGLVGYNDSGLIRNSYNTGNVTGAVFTGGLVGQDISGTIINSYATGIIVGAAQTGGLLGGGTTVNIINSHATGSVHGAASTGGLVGAMTTGTVDNSYATGDVLGGAGTGGLVGTITTGSIIKSYATGAVVGTVEGVPNAGGAANVGGLVGSTTGSVSVSYASGTVSGGAGVGGLIGSSTGLTLNTYATGKVTANSNAGGLIGDTTGSVQNSYSSGIVSAPAAPGTTGALLGTSTVAVSNNFFDNQSNPGMAGVGAQSILGGVTGMSTANMMLQANFTTTTAANNNTSPVWDFGDIWIILPETMPFLRTFMQPLLVTANSLTKTYDGLTNASTVSYSITPPPTLGGALTYSYVSNGVTTYVNPGNAGSYAVTPAGLISTQQYLVSFETGNLIINPLALTGGTISSATSVYGSPTMVGTLSFDNTPINGSAVGTATLVNPTYSTGGFVN